MTDNADNAVNLDDLVRDRRPGHDIVAELESSAARVRPLADDLNAPADTVVMDDIWNDRRADAAQRDLHPPVRERDAVDEIRPVDQDPEAIIDSVRVRGSVVEARKADRHLCSTCMTPLTGHGRSDHVPEPFPAGGKRQAGVSHDVDSGRARSTQTSDHRPTTRW